MFIQPQFDRRRFLESLGMGFGALAAQSVLASSSATNGQLPGNRFTRNRSTAKSVIFLFMVGGPSQIDLFDYKPLLQTLDGLPVPPSIADVVKGTRHANVFHGCKDQLMSSPYRWSRHGESGMWVSELYPHVARCVDDLCFIHSMQADSNNHAPASYQLHTGDVRSGKASLGSWVTYGLGSESEDLPGYVVLFDAGPLGGNANYNNGFLPPAFQPTRFRVGAGGRSQSTVMDLLPPQSFADDNRKTIDLTQQLNEIHRQALGSFGELDARIKSYELAYRMQSSAMEVGDLDAEPQHIQRLYGLDHPDVRTQSFSRKCLLARRLVERGVRFVQLYDMPDKDGWDAHDKLVDNHTPRARWTDQPIAGLLRDLKQRGLLDTTLVIWASEFGRTPMMQGNFGRQHNAAGFTIFLAGGGVRAGARIGATDELGLMAVERPLQFRDLHATILTALGISHEDLFFEVNGRKERLTGVAGSAKPIAEVLL